MAVKPFRKRSIVVSLKKGLELVRLFCDTVLYQKDHKNRPFSIEITIIEKER